MGKALKTVGVIIGAAALIATGVGALAMPALAGTTTLFGVSVGTLNTISSGLVAVGGMLDKPKSQGSAAPDEWTSNPDQPIPFLMGRMGVAGKIVQRDEFGPDNMYQGIVGILSGAGPIRAVTSFAGDKQPVSFGANGIAVTSQWEGEMWMVRRSGAQPDTVLTVPAGLKTGGSAFEWSSAAKLSGKACYLQVLGENSKGTAFPAGIPDPVHVAEGIFGYDPRYDDTYPGGAGPCRLGVRSTYRWIEDGGIGGLNWALGLIENGQVVGGIGASIDGIDVPAFVEVANIADANGWKLAAWPDTSEDVSAVLDQLLQAAGAVRARHAGKISCVSRGAPRASVATITARDTAGDIELDTAPSLFNRLNTITPRFMSEAAGWVLTPANPVAFAQYVTDDGGKHGDQIDYRFVPLLKQAAELAAYDILDAREPFSGTIPLKAHMRHLKRGDTFDIDEPGFLMDGVKCIVLSRSYDPKTAQVRIGFRSETDSKHALALGKTTTLPDFPTLTPTDPTIVSPPLPEDWVIVVRPPATDGTQLPGFDLTGIVSNATATAIIVEHGPTEEGPWTTAYQGPPTVTTIPIDGLQSSETYFIAIQYQRGQNYSDRMVYGPYTAPDLIANVDPELIQAQIDEATASLQLALTQLQAAQEALNTLVETANADFDSRLNAVDTGLSGLQSGQINLQEQIDGRATTSQLNFQINRIDGQQSIIGTLQDTVNDLPNQFVSTTNYETLLAEVANARGPYGNLAGRFSAQQQAIVDGLTGKVDVSAFTSLSAEVADARGGRPSIAVHLADLVTARINADGALGQRVDDTQAWLNLTDGAVGGLLTRMVTVEAGLDGKASVTAVENALAVSGTASANASEALTLAASADGKASASWSATFDVNGYQSGWTSFNNGTIAVTAHRADLFRVEMPGNPADRVDLSGVYGLRIYKANVKRVHIGFK